jgi:aconitase A
MDWVKIPTDNILYSEFKDSELIALIKYQALFCQLEKEPSETQLRRILNQKQIKFVQSYAEVVQELCEREVEVVKTKRNRDKESYKEKQSLKKNSASGKTTERKLVSVTDKIREDKIREEYSLKEEKEKEESDCPFLDEEPDEDYAIRQDAKKAVMILGEILQKKNNRKYITTAWNKPIELMMRKEEIKPDRIFNALAWYGDHIGEPYIPIIECGKTLREKFTKLENAMTRPAENKPNNVFYRNGKLL